MSTEKSNDTTVTKKDLDKEFAQKETIREFREPVPKDDLDNPFNQKTLEKDYIFKDKLRLIIAIVLLVATITLIVLLV